MLLFNRYEYNPQTDLIGKGGFSRVYKALDKKFNRYLALKIYNSSELSERYSPNAEIQRVIELDHPNISRYIDIEEFENKDSFGQVEKIQVCVMELLEGGNLAKYYNLHKDLNVFRKLLIDVLNGLSYLHSNGIIHRDIKPANILIKQNLDRPVAKITDFGISKRSDASGDSSSSALIVSIPYMAPEQLNANKYGIDEKVHYNIDLWALGVAVYEILSGEMLFKNNKKDSSEQIMINIVAPDVPDKIRFLPEPFNEFVAKCIIKDAKKRIKTAEELLLILQPFPSDTSRITGALNTSENKSQVSGKMIQPAEDANLNIFNNEEEKQDGFTGDTTQIISPLSATIKNNPGKDAPADTAENETRMIEKVAEDTATIEKINAAPDLTNDDTRILSSKADFRPAEPMPIISLTNLPDHESEPLSVSEHFVQDNENEEKPEDETRIFPDRKHKKEVSTSTDKTVPTADETRIIPDHTHEKISEPDQPVIAVYEKNSGPFTIGNETILNSGENILSSKPVTEKEHPKVTLFNRYDYYPATDLIGKGGFSRVYKALDQKLGRWVALKVYKTSEFSDRYSPIAEIKRVVNLDHSNICRYLDIEEIENVNPFGEKEKIQVCVMELLDSGNFLDYFTNSGKDLEVLKKLLRDVLHGIAYLHKNGIIHRDIKPANILIKKTIEGPVAKITDFGISKLSDSVNNNSSSALIVSIPYMAPEQLNTKKYGINEKISYNLDLWSLGVTIYEVITGKVLFKNSEQDSSEQIMANIMATDLPRKISELPQPFKDIVAYCIVKNANERAQKAEELLVLLNAPIVELSPAITSPELPDTKPALPEVTPEATIKAPDQPAITDPAEPPVRKKRIMIAEPDPVLEKRAQKHISVLKVSIAAAALLLVMASLFYFKASMDEKKLIDLPVVKDTLRKSTTSSLNVTKSDSPATAAALNVTDTSQKIITGYKDKRPATISGVNRNSVKKKKRNPITN